MNGNKGISKLMAVSIAVIVAVAAICSGYYLWISSHPTAPPTKDKILIGIENPSTGTYADLGRYLLRGYVLWRDFVNAKGGIYVAEYGKRLPVEFVIYDDGSDPSKAVELVERLILVDKVDYIFGGYGSPIVLSATTVAEKYGVPYINTQGFALSIFQRNYTWIFSTCPTSPMFAETALKIMSHIPENQRPKTAAFLYEDSAVCIDHVTFMKKFIEEWKLPLTIVFEERYKPKTTDFTATLLKVKSSGAEAFFAISYTSECMIITRQMKEVGYYPVYFQTAMGASVPEYIKELGPDADGATTTYIAGPALNPEYAVGMKELWDFFTKIYKPEEWHYCIATGFSGGQFFEAIINKTGTLDYEAFRKAAHEITVTTCLGPVKVAPDGSNEKAVYACAQVQNGTYVVVWPPEAMMPGTKFIWPAKKPPS